MAVVAHIQGEKIIKHLFKIIMLIYLLALSDVALAGKWIMGISIGAAKSDNDDGLLNSQLAASGLNATASTENSIDIRWQLYGGYDFVDRWGIELGYLDLGKVETTFTGTTSDIEAFLNSAQDIHPQTAQGWLLSMIHYFPIDYDTRLKARIGVYNWEADYTLQGGNASKSVSENGSDISFGIGLELGEWHATGTIGHLKWDHYTIEDKQFEIFSFGFSFVFQ